MRLRPLPVCAAALLSAATVLAQTTPTGTLTGKVVDPEGLALPGVAVSVTSTALQGQRSASTSANGDYIIPFLPAGGYVVVFEVSGFQKVEKRVRIQVAETVPLSAQLRMAGLEETITVSAEAADFTPAPTAAKGGAPPPP